MFSDAVRLEVSSATRSTCFGPIHDFLDSICLHGVHKPPPPSKFFYPCLFLPILEDRFLGWITSSTFYTTRGTRPRTIAPFSNRGPRARKHLFVGVAFNSPGKLQSRKPPFRILPSLLGVASGLLSSSFFRSLHPQMYKRAD